MKNTISTLLVLLFITSCKDIKRKKEIYTEKNPSNSFTLNGNNLNTISIAKDALYPETILYNSRNDQFIVGSFRDGNIYEIDHKGNANLFIESNLRSILGMQIDYNRNRILALSSDIGASINRYKGGIKNEATLAVFDLISKELLFTVDLAKLKPNSKHLANGLAIDTKGNAYITDSFTPVIYKADTNGNASIFLEDSHFVGKGINLNGIVYHTDGYLITVKKSDGTLFKIPLSEPKKFSKINIEDPFYGGDGLFVLNNNNLALATNIAAGKATESIFLLQTNDNWLSAKVTNEKYLGKVYPTTIVSKGDNLFVLHSNLNVLVSSSKAELLEENTTNDVLKKRATIQHIGTLK